MNNNGFICERKEKRTGIFLAFIMLLMGAFCVWGGCMCLLYNLLPNAIAALLLGACIIIMMVYMIGNLINSKLEVYTIYQLVYTTWYGREIEFSVWNIGEINTHIHNGTEILTIYSREGNVLLKLNSTMKNYDRFVNWLEDVGNTGII